MTPLSSHFGRQQSMSSILHVRHPVFSRIDILTADLEKEESEITIVKLIKN